MYETEEKNTNMLKVRQLFCSAFVVVIFILPVRAFSQKDSLRSLITRIAASAGGTVGVGLLQIESGDTLYLNRDHHFPMQSVYKFPLAMYVLNLVDSGKLSLDQKLHITKKDIPDDTWSPMREKFPAGNIELTLRELLLYSISKSDNNATDILFRIVGGPQRVENYLRGLGVQGMAIKKTEKQMHDNEINAFQNWCQPQEMTKLLRAFYHSYYLSFESTDLLMKLMTESENSPKRILGMLPQGAQVAHKTGTSNTNKAGVNAATNDVGIITLPNGEHLALVVYISMSKLDLAARESVIAQIARASWDYYSSSPHTKINVGR
ncbi:MAG: class A beta-lactamase, subclass A2 [Ignavibacteriota bacterium]